MHRRKLSTVIAVALAWAPGLLTAQKTPTRPPITGIAKVSVYATDLEKSDKFYGQFLGFPRVKAGAPSSTAQYRVNPRQTIEVVPSPTGETDFLDYIGFATSNIEALRLYLLSRNISVGAVHRQSDGSQVLWVKAPEGHQLQFVQFAAHAHMVPLQLQKSEKPVSHHILHAGFIVHDRDMENHFFRDVLGFREGWHGGMKDNKTDWVDMQVPNGSDWIEYMMHDTTAPTAAQSGVMNHLALGVANIQKAAALLEQRGWHSSPREKAQMGRDGKWQLNLYDPNGTRVELMEFVPVQTPCCSPYTMAAPAPDPK